MQYLLKFIYNPQQLKAPENRELIKLMQSQFKDEWLNKAFQLAYFIHGERETAKRIAVNAMNKLETASNAQFKRYYYTPTGRSENSRAARSRVSLNDLQLLQRLVFVESENFEKEKEDQKEISEENLLKHFIKHLVRISLKRNSFYVTLGISRILHNYGTNDAMEIYNIVVQDPERVHDDYYYRSRKGILMKELKKRFGKLLGTVRVNRGEERFDQKDADEETLETAKECLKTFTPWNSICVIPEKFDPFDDMIKPFYFGKDDPDEEHRIEVNRIHATLHPKCFQRLTDALNLPSSEQKMEIPKFMISTNRQNIDDNCKNPPNLEADELQQMQDFLIAQTESRRAFSANVLRIVVDGNEQAEIALNEANKVNFDLDETAELIEVCVPETDGDLVLATHLLSFAELEKGNLEEKILLQNGTELSFNFTPTKDEYGEIIGVICGIGVAGNEESKPFAVVPENKTFSFSEWFQNLRWALRPALTFGLILLIFGFGWVVYRQFTENEKHFAEDKNVPSNNGNREILIPEPPKEVVVEKESPEEKVEMPKIADEKKVQNSENNTSDPVDKKKENVTPKKERSVKQKREFQTVTPQNPLVANKDKIPSEERGTDKNGVLRLPIRENNKYFPKENNATRNIKIRGKSLAEIRKIYIEITGDDILGGRIKDEISAELSRSNISVVQTKQEADGRLIIYIRDESDGDEPEDKSITIILRLVNEEGFVIFPNRKGVSGWKYIGVIGKLPPRISNDLANAVLK